MEMISSAIECAEIGMVTLKKLRYEKDEQKKAAMLLDAQRWIGKALYAIGTEKENQNGKAKTPQC